MEQVLVGVVVAGAVGWIGLWLLVAGLAAADATHADHHDPERAARAALWDE